MPQGSGPGFRRPVIVVQGDTFNISAIRTVICVPLTTNIAWLEGPASVFLSRDETGLPEDSVAVASHVICVDKRLLEERVGKLPRRKFDLVLSAIDVVLGR